MTTTTQPSRLHELWEGGRVDELSCFVCSKTIEKDPLIRTFRPHPRSCLESPQCSRVLPGKTRNYLVYDRHLHCCTEKVFITISHVWDCSVSTAHHQGPNGASPELQSSVSDYIFEMLERISNGLDLRNDTEIWYDYISVPQWKDEIKFRILAIIPEIFHNLSRFTLVYLHDVETECLERLVRQDEVDHMSEQDSDHTFRRALAVTQICNAKWFSRVWTISEFIHSKKVKVMTKEGHVDRRARHALILRLARVWEEESINFDTVQDMKKTVNISQNLIPRTLGFIVRARNKEQVDFGFAFTFLSRRGCYSDIDFCHALLGLVRADLNGESLEEQDSEKLMRQIATGCMRSGDYSPLLMVPRYAYDDRGGLPSHVLSESGFVDTAVFGLGNGRIGDKKDCPSYHRGSSFSTSGSNIKLECAGKVTFASTNAHQDPILRFLQSAMFALDYTGPFPVPFIRTVAERLHNVHRKDVQDLLHNPAKCQKIKAILENWYDNTTRFARKHRDIAQQLADLMGLTSILPNTREDATPMAYMDAEGGALHNYSPGSLIAARCPGCHKAFVYQAGLHRSPAEVRGAVAYRIAGVHWGKARPDSAGILVKNGIIVGRLLWANRGCKCRIAEKVNVRLEHVPHRLPRET